MGIALICAAGIIALAFFSRAGDTAPNSLAIKNNSLVAINNTVREQLVKDSDNDGLADWEESLWKTDPNNPDSDGDRTNDGEEVLAGRDPILAGPNDSMVPVAGTAASNTNTEELNETQKLGRRLFAEYAEKKQRGESFTEDDITSLLMPLAGSISPTKSAAQYTAADLTLGKTDTIAAFRRYGNEFGAIERRHSSPGAINELDALATFATTQNPDALKVLEVQSARYQNFAKEAIKMEVPPSVAVLHIDLLNTFSEYAHVLASVQAIENDPFGALLALQKIHPLTIDLYRNLQRVAHFFKEKDIVFPENEPGNLFTVIGSLPSTIPTVAP